MSLTVTIYMRPGCHLCAEAVDRVRAIAGEMAVEIDERNIESNDELHRKYLELIPVIEIDGEIFSRLVEYRDPTFAEHLTERLGASY